MRERQVDVARMLIERGVDAAAFLARAMSSRLLRVMKSLSM